MSTTNAPQPTATGPAESFDSTVAPPTGNISAIGLPGPDNSEAPIHSGAANGIDPYFHTQYIALASFNWSVVDDPGKLLWSIPIHPSETHQWLAHLAKMYNAWAGGFDFAVKIAGTGFHAGAIMVVRIPPNISPSKLNTVPSITAFEYNVMDPKMLEVELKQVMDQRNIMYHYMPLDVNNPLTFGGYLSFYVMLPLATSSTGATEISVQILARPSQNFLFTQIRPIDMDVVPIAVPTDLEDALDFQRVKSLAATTADITKIVIKSPTSLRFVDSQTFNCIQFSQDPMNGYFMPRRQTVQPMEFQNTGMFSLYLQWQHDPDANSKLVRTNEYCYLAWSDALFTDTKIEVPVIEGAGEMFFIAHLTDKSKTTVFVALRGLFEKQDPSHADLGKYKQRFRVDNLFTNDKSWVLTINKDNSPFAKDEEFFASLAAKKLHFEGFVLDNDALFGFDMTKYSPPIEESFVLFADLNDHYSCQPWELTTALNKEAYSGFMDKNTCLVFELIDTKVDLPILAVKLHYSGYFTTIAHKDDLIFAVRNPGRYKFKYLYKTSAATPLVSGRQQKNLYH